MPEGKDYGQLRWQLREAQGENLKRIGQARWEWSMK